MTAGTSVAVREVVEEELVYGALRRERQWRVIGLSGAGFGVLGCLAAAAVAISWVFTFLSPFGLETLDPSYARHRPVTMAEALAFHRSASGVTGQSQSAPGPMKCNFADLWPAPKRQVSASKAVGSTHPRQPACVHG